jgi:ribosomal protein S12 methylthiotransferase
VLVDRIEDGIAIARTAGDAPEIDGLLRFAADATTRAGEFASVEVTGADTYDLRGRLAQ